MEHRVSTYWEPYHASLAEEIARIRGLHGYCLLYDAHSIRSRVTRLFAGELPAIKLGTANGVSCSAELESALRERLRRQAGYRWVINGRFVGGYITRHYGRPDLGVHAIQLELAQSTYMDERPPWTFDTAKAERLRPHLGTILSHLEEIALTGLA